MSIDLRSAFEDIKALVLQGQAMKAFENITVRMSSCRKMKRLLRLERLRIVKENKTSSRKWLSFEG